MALSPWNVKRKAGMTTIVVDTCVWLDLAKDFRQRATLHALEELIRGDIVRLAVPRQVLDEFARNKDRVVAESAKSLSSLFKRVKGAVDEFGDVGRKGIALRELNDIDHRMATMGEVVNNAIGHIERLLAQAAVLEPSEEMLARAGKRGLERRAPFHKSKNSMADAVLIEQYANLLTDSVPADTFAFVTHNKHDFSNMAEDERQPHPDLAHLFDGTRSAYAIALGELLNEIDPEGLQDASWQFEYEQEPRRLSEILAAEKLLFRQVWYNRHESLRYKIAAGEVRVLPDGEVSAKPYLADECSESVWNEALAAAKRTEEEVGVANLGPLNDLEWAMIHGKLSALRWVLGDEWDFLDT